MSKFVNFLHEQSEASFRWTIRLPVPAVRPGIVKLWPTEGDPLDLRDDGFLWRMTRWLDRQTIEVDFREPVTGQAIVTYRPIHEPIGSGEGKPANGSTLNVNPADRL